MSNSLRIRPKQYNQREILPFQDSANIKIIKIEKNSNKVSHPDKMLYLEGTLMACQKIVKEINECRNKST